MFLTWDEPKRQANLAKHGLDFADAHWVLDSAYRLDVEVIRGGELRLQSFSYVAEALAVLTLVHVERAAAARVISFRRASSEESEVYLDWLEGE
ncbi:BrnT family toxin [Melaminivora sp.]|uniref:BrnT family toxin n=1 Tax=Melaminivora sp. TaxID=1933032 RepID=UPI0028ADBDAF|nr:BrnT family toxin [Melaminivora sp.]